MAIYFFDFLAEDIISVDEEGFELPDVGEAHSQAVTALIEAVRCAIIEGASEQNFAVKVRDEIGPVLEVRGIFSSEIFRKQ